MSHGMRLKDCSRHPASSRIAPEKCEAVLIDPGSSGSEGGKLGVPEAS